MVSVRRSLTLALAVGALPLAALVAQNPGVHADACSVDGIGVCSPVPGTLIGAAAPYISSLMPPPAAAQVPDASTTPAPSVTPAPSAPTPPHAGVEPIVRRRYLRLAVLREAVKRSDDPTPAPMPGANPVQPPVVGPEVAHQ